MTEDIGAEVSPSVEHGREREAADFYRTAFGAQEADAYNVDGDLVSVEICIRNCRRGLPAQTPVAKNSPPAVIRSLRKNRRDQHDFSAEITLFGSASFATEDIQRCVTFVTSSRERDFAKTGICSLTRMNHAIFFVCFCGR